jgi:hypothetical protein
METSPDAAGPYTEQPELADEELGQILLARMRDRESRRAELEVQYREVAENLEREQRHIEHLRALLQDLGLLSSENPAPSAASNGARSSQRLIQAFVAGNRAPTTPERRPEFKAVSLTEAARQLLQGGETLHTEDFVRLIFDVQSPAQLKTAKATMRSTLAVGANRGYWDRGEEASTFRMRRERDGTMVT